ncbi:MAG: hypothetical protein ACR2K5_02980 [Pseudolabrys sp.]
MTSHPKDYERSDADPRLVGLLGAGTAVFLIAVPFLLAAIYPGSQHRGGIEANLPVPPAPRLQTDPRGDLERLRASETQRLDSFGWADQAHSVAHMPIERAMSLLAQRGLAGWPSPPAPNHSPQR